MQRYMRNKGKNINGLWFKGRFVCEGMGLPIFNSMSFYHGGGYVCPTLRAEKADAGVCVRCEKTKSNNMKRNLHDEVRTVYRACRRKYGVEKTQDECLRVFKIIFPEQMKARGAYEGEMLSMTDEAVGRLKDIFAEWNPSGELRRLVESIDFTGDMGRDEFICFCDDITPVAMCIRKLTPRECFRLMGVDDKDIDKIQESGVSNSGQYKLAGNSIVVDVLFHLFRKLLVETGPDVKKGEFVQLSLF